MAVIIVAGIIASCWLRIDFRRTLEGIFIIKAPSGAAYVLTDDIYVEEEDRIVFAFSFEDAYDKLFNTNSGNRNKLDFDWHGSEGSGFVFNNLPGDRRLLMNFGRFVDTNNGRKIKGLFVGGAPPYKYLTTEGGRITKSESGVAYHDGRRWYHIWCNVNEALVVGPGLKTLIFPSDLDFDDSSVLFRTEDTLALRSRHHIARPEAQLAMTRVALFRHNETYFTLAIRLRNTGTTSLPYSYLYGDEPWVGDYGNCLGNVGWTRSKLHYHEGRIDPVSNSFAGITDLGNPLIKEMGPFTGMASFIEWEAATRPDTVFFANLPTDDINDGDLKPLTSPDSRSIMLRWGPRLLSPGESHTMIIAVGMSQAAAGAALPDKPSVFFDMARLDYWLDK